MQELEYELDRAKGKIGVLEKTHLHDKEDYNSKIAEY